MDVLKDSLPILKCVHCENYLTYGPVYLRHEDGEAVCSECMTPEEPVTRNKQYETVAKQLLFPCKYEGEGCPKKIEFSEEKPNNHENVCDFKQRICPVLPSGQCEWLGHWNKLLEHCRSQHPEQVLEHPCTLIHDITKSSLNTFLIPAFSALFLLYAKVCCTSGKMYHCIRVLGNSDKANYFKYNLDIKKNEINMTKPGKVAPEGCLALQENISLTTGINSLLEFVGDYEGTTFTFTIQDLSEPGTSSIQSSNIRGIWKNPDFTICKMCQKAMFSLDKIDICSSCKRKLQFSSNPRTSSNKPTKVHGSKIRSCVNACFGCVYQDVPSKCTKHEMYFCKFNTACDHDDCANIKIQRGTLFKHYTQFHQAPTYKLGTAFFIKNTKDDYKDLLLSSDIGTIECQYYLSNKRFQFEVFTPLSSIELKNYTCIISIMNPNDNDIKISSPKCNFSGKEDWNVAFEKKSMSSWNNQFKIIVSLNRNQ